MSTIGHVKKQKDGRYVGELRTLSIQAAIEIIPVADKASDKAPDFAVMSRGIEIGAAWTRKGQRSGKDYVSVSFTAPEFGSGMFANLGHAAGSNDPNEFALIHNAPRKQ